MIATDYAKALYSLGSKANMAHVREVLKRRGHEKLLPRIYAEYQKLELQAKRRVEAAAVTPEKERTRVLLQLYKKLTA